MIKCKFFDDDVILGLFSQWMEDAKRSELNDPNAAVLATADHTGFPNARAVLVKSFDKNGFVFYTNTESCKGKEIEGNPRASLCFHWKSLHRQLRLRGLVEKCGDSEADLYYSSRSRGSQIGAWSSKQSQQMVSRDLLNKAVAKYTSLYESQEILPRPVWWSGFRVRPLYIEFWSEGPDRLHERVVFSRKTITEKWESLMLYP
ncbi:pyridoxamine 5'-phosphate oxidase [Candidatus Liberibacter sp.]|uniref:pyridoxamine 5'-phosphate oxidase n=1 Tax=Candidatus Liberibacter sp. TaxID=34022 RepID=UPI0015F57B50|nr:pyridoxamine 5'-phosphate oxidase [Candidatus Liberibacter sp.]MBA5723836.1 pyridoxamine 5'-phosphate oxidase [Candidatus Liberibacter sp.]